ncbi:EAL domain-containing protein [Dechloromonas sp. XY25]|uniref:EAL domain-containing protein n=1 Tax=Dechloromonas hankyongensis TaxID=2908002 RepID=A0ABS9JYB1_9RHOO|nr:EAL domain-containing protein [Dechloromonas hankyongensis]MCG2575884.1 EAL domain-containing protein [Dechloromonas hankyongensis]
MPFKLPHSLRARLIALTVVVEMVMISAIVWNSQRLTEEHLVRQFDLRRAEISLLLQAALGPAMAQRDYAAVADTLANAQRLQGLVYLTMLDESGQQIAAASDDHATRTDGVREFDIPVIVEKRSYGHLLTGIDLRFLEEARREILFQNVALALLGILASSLVLGAIALWLTQRLGHLAEASDALAAGRSFSPLRGSSNDDIGLVINAFNDMAQTIERRVHDLRDAEARQRNLVAAVDAERSRLDALLSAMRLGLVFVDQDERICYLNPAFARLWSVSLDGHLANLPLSDLRRWLDPALAESKHDLLFAGDGTSSELITADGRIVTQQGVAVTSTGGIELGRLWIFEDITSERQISEHLVFMAERDPLTGLANRARFTAELERLRAHFQRDPSQHGAVLYFDLDEFKAINDSFGHRAGDNVLVRTADAVGRLVRSDELFARLGGDEFAIVAPGADRRGAEAMAERVVKALSALSFEFDGRRFGLTSSLGIALLPEHGSNVEELVSHADAAMYQAKRSGKNCWRIYRPDLDESAQVLSQLAWNDKIQAALNEDRLVLHFQGVHVASTRQISHYEALVRMVDPDNPGSLLLPSSFIPAAERTGRIVDIDRWVIRAAISKLAGMPGLPGLAVNVSARSFDDPTLAGKIRALLGEFGVEPRRLIIELTETAALANIGDSERFIDDLRKLGCTVCLDDFGVGFSSFAYLKHLSADVLKIDGMFIRNLLGNREDYVFVRAIVEVARGLGKKTVAEFVGDEQTLALLAEIGVDYAQGYHLSFPIAEISAP